MSTRQCKKCGTSERYKCGACRACAIERSTRNYILNRSARIAYVTKWTKENHEYRCRYLKKYYRTVRKSDPQKEARASAVNEAKRKANGYYARYRARNLEKIRLQAKEWAYLNYYQKRYGKALGGPVSRMNDLINKMRIEIKEMKNG